jgi:predicted nucleotidyltransferase component of viral defense system
MAIKEKSILTLNQKKILEVISVEKYFTERFYLAGGTALSEFYFKHRLSEDLDFFNENEEVDSITIMRFFEKNAKKIRIKNIETKNVFGFFTFFLNFTDGDILKVDFNYYPFPRIEKGVKFKNLQVESVYDIGVDKVHTIVLKPRARDYIDVYFIIKEKGYDFSNLLRQAKVKFDWHITTLELAARFMDASQISDFPRMIKEINHDEWRQFFMNEAMKLKKEIFK